MIFKYCPHCGEKLPNQDGMVEIKPQESYPGIEPLSPNTTTTNYGFNDVCLIEEFYKDPMNKGKPCMIACPCKRHSSYSVLV